ncbi:hypothetical protein BHM03_00027960 [Ensete ventricosum]|nr:hypothetical protein BHM03_00027960 [Ensete ventricosum]
MALYGIAHPRITASIMNWKCQSSRGNANTWEGERRRLASAPLTLTVQRKSTILTPRQPEMQSGIYCCFVL